MENIKTTYMPVGQVARVNDRRVKLINWIGKRKVVLMLGAILIALLSLYAVLIAQFVHLLQILN